MSISFNCASCQREIRVADERAGGMTVCSGCGKSMAVPVPAELPPVIVSDEPRDPPGFIVRTDGPAPERKDPPPPPEMMRRINMMFLVPTVIFAVCPIFFAWDDLNLFFHSSRPSLTIPAGELLRGQFPENWFVTVTDVELAPNGVVMKVMEDKPEEWVEFWTPAYSRTEVNQAGGRARVKFVLHSKTKITAAEYAEFAARGKFRGMFASTFRWLDPDVRNRLIPDFPDLAQGEFLVLEEDEEPPDWQELAFNGAFMMVVVGILGYLTYRTWPREPATT